MGVADVVRLGATDIRHARRARLVGLVRQLGWATTGGLVAATGRDDGEVSADLHTLAELGVLEHPAHGIWCLPGAARDWPLTASDVLRWLADQWEPVTTRQVAEAFGVVPRRARARLKWLRERGDAENLRADEPGARALWVAL